MTIFLFAMSTSVMADATKNAEINALFLESVVQNDASFSYLAVTMKEIDSVEQASFMKNTSCHVAIVTEHDAYVDADTAHQKCNDTFPRI